MFELETQSNADLMLQIRERDEQPYGDPPPSGDEGLDDESDQADNESNDNDGSVGTGIGVKLSHQKNSNVLFLTYFFFFVPYYKFKAGKRQPISSFFFLFIKGRKRQ